MPCLDMCTGVSNITFLNLKIILQNTTNISQVPHVRVYSHQKYFVPDPLIGMQKLRAAPIASNSLQTVLL